MVAETYGRAVIITFASFSLKRSMNDCDKDYLRIGDQRLAHSHRNQRLTCYYGKERPDTNAHVDGKVRNATIST